MREVKKLSVSLPADLAELLDEMAKKEGVPRSRIVAEALRQYFGVVERRGSGWEYPTVLGKLERSGGLGLRSPRFAGRRLRVGWVVEEV